MHDFPIWLKLIIWLSLGSVVVYTAANILISAFQLQSLSILSSSPDDSASDLPGWTGMISFFEKHRLGFKFCVSSDVLLNAIGTAGAASSEAQQNPSPYRSIDINSASIEEVKSHRLNQLISENVGHVASIAAVPMLATGSTENAANAGHAAFTS